MFKFLNEEKSHGYLFGLVRYISIYLKTLWSMLFYPQRTLTCYFSKRSSSDFMKPGAFLVTNIFLTYFIGEIIGYKVPQFPFKVSFMNNTIVSNSVNYAFSIASVIFGLTVFFLVMKGVMKNRNLNYFISLVLPSLCYGSVVYLPNLALDRIYRIIFGNGMQNFLLGVLSQNRAEVTFIGFIKFLFYLLIPAAMLLWWLWLIYKGLNLSGIEAKMSIRKIIIFSYGIFLVIQIALSLLTFSIVYGATLRDYKVIINNDIERELSKTPPNYYKAKILAQNISDNEMMPEYIRYVAILRKITYTLATPILKQDN